MRRASRNLAVLSTVGRKTGAFKDQRLGRGGAKNTQKEYLEEYEESFFEEDFSGEPRVGEST